MKGRRRKKEEATETASENLNIQQGEGGRCLLETAHGEEPMFWFKAQWNPVQFSSVQFSPVQQGEETCKYSEVFPHHYAHS